MGTISRVTTWSTGDTLTAADLNGEFDNILSTANGSLNADNLGVTAGIASALKAVVLDSNKDFADGTGSNQIRNLTISGSLKIGTTFLPDASGGADLGSSSLEWGDLYIADDKFINLGSDQNILIGYDETTTDSLKIAATEGAALAITLMADEGDDAGDEWKLNVADGGTITLGNDIASAGTYVTHLTLTPHATVSSSTLALAGALTVAGTAGITGVATVGGLTIGSAVINEAELETIDGITAGTVAASKAVVVDSNKDIGTFRNITLNGTLSDGNYTFDTSGNVTGLGTVGSGAITSTGVVTGTGFTIGSAAINEAELETIDGVTAGTVAASKAVVVDSNKDIGSFRNVTLTGELDGGSLDISGDADIDGTTNLDAVDIDGAVQVDATITVGADDQGYDVTFFGDTASAYLLWDTSADKLLTAGGATIDIVKDKLLIGSTAVTTTAAELNVLDAVSAGTVTASLAVVVDSNKDIGSFRNITLTGELDAGSLDISGDADIDGTANLDAVDIDGAVQIDNTVTVGVNGTGYDVQFFGDTSGSSVLWDQSADDLILTNAGLAVGSDATGDVYYRDANGFLARLAIGSDGQVLTSTGTLPNWEAAGAGGSFSGPGTSTENAIVRFTNTSGNSGDNSGILIDDSNNVTGAANVTLSGELDAATGDFSGDVNVAGEVQTASIGYTDGDNAMTIADGGGVTFAQDATFGDNTKVTLGTGGDADLYYDGTNVILNPRVAGNANLGLNTTTIAGWGSDYFALAVGGSARGVAANTGATAGGSIFTVNNVYFDGSNWKYAIANEEGSYLTQANGSLGFAIGNSTSHSAGATATLSTALTIDSAGNMILGGTTTTTNWTAAGKLFIEAAIPGIGLRDTTGSADDFMIVNSNGVLTFANDTENTQPMRIDEADRVSMGYNGTLQGRLQLYGAYTAPASGIGLSAAFLTSSNSYTADVGGVLQFGGIYNSGGDVTQWSAIQGLKENSSNGNTAGYLAFINRDTSGNIRESWRITSTGQLTASHRSPMVDITYINVNTGTVLNAQPKMVLASNTTSELAGVIGEIRIHQEASPHANYRAFVYTQSSSNTQVFRVMGDGDCENANNSYGSTSDLKLKMDITDARSYWDDFKQLQFKKFRFKTDVAEDADAPYRFGLIAQEVEPIFPSIVKNNRDIETKTGPVLDDEGNATYEMTDEVGDDGELIPALDGDGNRIPITKEQTTLLDTTTKSLKYSVLSQIGLKVVQELQTRLEAAEAKIAALEAA